MIAFLRGIIIETKNNRVVIDVNGMGYRVFCLPSFVLSVAEKKDKEILLHTYQYIRENVVELYGFETTREEQMFEILIAISGIGPKGAMSILAAANTAHIDYCNQNIFHISHTCYPAIYSLVFFRIRLLF